MTYLRRSVDISKDGRRTVLGTSSGISANQTIRIDLDTNPSRLIGWYRLKVAIDSEPEQISIEALGNDGDPVASWTAIRPGKILAAYIYIPKAQAARFEFSFPASVSATIGAQLRPIGLSEYIWRSLAHGIAGEPRRFLAAFLRPPGSTFVLLDFPGPRRPTSDYATWIETLEPALITQHLARRHGTAVDLPISILLCANGQSTVGLKRTLASIQNQRSRDWRLLLAYPASAGRAVKDVLHDIADTDERIALVRLNTSDPVAALNELLARARTPYVWRIHENDELSPFAIEACARQISTEPDCRILVADDDSLDGDGSRFAPRFKPQTFSIELFHSYNYFGRAAILHTDSVRVAGGWRAGFSGAEDYDLLLRLSETCPPPSIRHLALVLYHERQSSAGPARISRKELNAAGAGLRALTDHFSRMSVPATIEHVPPTMYRVRYHIAEPKPLLSIIIPFRDRADLLRPCIASILDRSTYRNFEMLLINNGSCEPETRDLLHSYRSDNRIRIIDDAGPFNYSALNNNAARIAQGSFYCLLNNDTQVIAADWIEDMLGYASQSGIGCVGAKLFYGNGLVQHAGMLLGLPSGAEHAFRCATPDDPGYLNRLTVASNCSCVTGACLVISRRIFWEVGGLNEALPVTFNDVDLCIKVSKAGYRNVFTPFARLFHFEASTRGSDLLPQNMIRFNNELEFMRVRHGQDLTDDPYYSPHLTRKKTDFTIRLDYDGT